MIKVSIIVPVYNVEKFLPKCLDSLIEQTLKDIEIICVNDCSTDSSPTILKEYATKDNRIKIINLKCNGGPSASRNSALKLVQGEFIGFVDSDDWVDCNYYEKLYNSAKKYNCDIAIAGIKRPKKNSAPIRKKFKSFKIYRKIKSKLKADCVPRDNFIWNKIYKFDIWKKHKIVFTPGRNYEDIPLTTRILSIFDSIVTVPNTYYYYRRNPNSIVANKSNKNKEDYKWAKTELYNYTKEIGIKFPLSSFFYDKEFVKIGNFKLIRKNFYPNGVYYYLFGFIPLFKKSL